MSLSAPGFVYSGAMNLRVFPALPLLLAGAALASAQSRPHVYDLKNVAWSVSLDPDHASITGDVTNTLVPDQPLKQIVLDAGPQLEIDALTVNGEKRPYKHAGDKLTITLSAPKGQTLNVRIVYHGTPQAGVYFVPASRAYPAHTPIAYTQGEMEDNRDWLPTYDYPDNKATSEGRIEVPSDWSAISNGKLVEVVDKGARRVFHWKMDVPHSTYLISFTAGPFVEQKESWDGIPISYWVPPGLEEQGRTSFGGTNKIVALYSRLTHYRYPYVKFTQDVVPDYMFGGMENITAVTQTISTLHPADVEPLDNSKGLVAHELAHQWFGDLVTCRDWSNTWLNEGWATFMPSFWIRESEGQDAFDLSRYDTFSGGLSPYGGSKRPVVWTGYKNPIDMFDAYAYPGGASRMFMLMHRLGEDTFWKAVSDYLHDCQYQNVTTERFFSEISKSTGKDLSGFMKQWFFTPAAPNLKVSVDGDNLVVTQPEPYFDLDTEVWIRDGDQWVKKPLHVSGAKTTLNLGPLASNPLLVDPECWLMAEIQSSLSLTAAQLIDLYKAAPNAAEKARIMDTMMAPLSPAQGEQMARSENFLGLKLRWLSRLGSDSADYMLELLKDPDARVRSGAIEGLVRAQKSGQDVLDALAPLSDSDPNESIRERAFGAILKLSNNADLADKAFTMDGYRDQYRQMALQWWVAHKPDIARTKCLQELANPSSEPVRVDAIRYLGTLKDAPGDRAVYQALLKVLSENSFSARVAAVGALADYGDKSALPEIRPLTDNPLVFMRGAAQSAVDRLSS